MRRLLGRWLDEAGATRRDVDDLTLATPRRPPTRSSTPTGWRRASWSCAPPRRGGQVTVVIRDFGNWRPPRGTHRGRGIMLMEGLTDAVEVVHSDEGTTVELSRRIGAEAA